MPESMQPTMHRALQIVVMLCATGLLFSHWVKTERDSDVTDFETSVERVAERNERSVPRSFVLPATPGVAFEQEAQNSDAIRQAQTAKCVAALRALGYQQIDSKTFLNAKLVEAVYIYQRAHNLPATGRLDELTMGMLKCV